MSCECRRAEQRNSGFMTSGPVAPKLPSLPQLAPCARASLVSIRTSSSNCAHIGSQSATPAQCSVAGTSSPPALLPAAPMDAVPPAPAAVPPAPAAALPAAAPPLPLGGAPVLDPPAAPLFVG